MSPARIALVVAFAAGCRSASPAESRDNAPAPMTRTVVSVGETFYPMRSDSALRAFVPLVQPVDSGGECRVMRTGGSGATMVAAYFPSFDSARTSVTLAFDSAGNLVRYGDRRGSIRFRTPPGMSDAQRDSARRALAAEPSTTIQLDYALDQGLATNRGGTAPPVAVIGTVRAVESLEALGPPTRRLQRTRRLCGV